MKRSVPIDAHSIGTARAAPREAGAVVALRETLLLNLLVPLPTPAEIESLSMNSNHQRRCNAAALSPQGVIHSQAFHLTR